MGHTFVIKIYHHNLKCVLEHWLSSQEKQKWVTKMLGFDYEIIYKKCKKNVVVDALYRKYDEEESLFSLSFPVPY